MKVINTRLDGCLLIEPKVHGDARGFFYESFHAGRFAEAGLDLAFVQTNVSRSAQGVLRAPAYQKYRTVHPPSRTQVLGKEEKSLFSCFLLPTVV